MRAGSYILSLPGEMRLTTVWALIEDLRGWGDPRDLDLGERTLRFDVGPIDVTMEDALKREDPRVEALVRECDGRLVFGANPNDRADSIRSFRRSYAIVISEWEIRCAIDRAMTDVGVKTPVGLRPEDYR